jgi:hypothetical protein
MSGFIPPLRLRSFMECTGVHSKEKRHQNKFISLQANGQERNSLLFPGTELYLPNTEVN